MFSSCNSKKYVNLDSHNVISKPKFDAILNGADTFSKFLPGNFVSSTLRPKVGVSHIKLKYWHEELLKSLKKSSPVERASNFGLRLRFRKSRLIFL